MLKGFLLGETAVTVYSAVLVTPLVLTVAARYLPSNIPSWIVLIVLAFILFIIAANFDGYLRAILHGVSIAMFLNAFLSTSIGAKLTAQLATYTPRSG